MLPQERNKKGNIRDHKMKNGTKMEKEGEKRDLILVNVETAELLLLPFSGDVERARYKLVDQSSHHSSTELRRSRDSEKQDPNRTLEKERREASNCLDGGFR